MKQANPKYKKYVHCYNNGRKVLYLCVLQTIYGCIESTFLWYTNIFISTLKDLGFTINLYDKCVANKMLNGKQCILVWYVSDAKVSHVLEEEVVRGAELETLRKSLAK